MKIEGYKIFSCNQWGDGVFGGADYDGENSFCINEPSEVIWTQEGKFSSTCLLEMHVKDMIVYELAAICHACQNMRF